jgi:hypothetical protein
LSNLQGYVSPELQATSGQAGAIANEAPIYTGTAGSIASLGTNTTNGVTNQNTQAANADMAGSGNIWNLGMGLAKLGVGAATGGFGTSLLVAGREWWRHRSWWGWRPRPVAGRNPWLN